MDRSISKKTENGTGWGSGTTIPARHQAGEDQNP